VKDRFSIQADAYKKFRPVYPQALYNYIMQFVQDRNYALDVATGNGQAAVALASYFQKVYAIDTSTAQLAQAPKKENIEYRQCAAEETFLAAHTFDLVTVAQAYHWLEHEAFATEVLRIAKQGAVIAVWLYDRFQTANAALNELMDHFYFQITGPYWDAARKHVDNHYNDLPFPYELLPTRPFAIEVRWTQAHLMGYLSSWSSVQKYIEVHGRSPLPLIQAEVAALMGAETIVVRFPIYLHLGRVG